MSAATTIETKNESTATDLLAPVMTGLEPTSAESLRAIFVPFLDRAQEWETRARAIVVSDEGDKRSMKLARESRLALRDIRCSVETARKAAKADALSRGRAIDGIANAIKGMIEPIERHLLEQETFAERAAENRRDALRGARDVALRAYGAEPGMFADLSLMAEDVWETTIRTAKLAHEGRLAAEREAEAARVASERIAAEKAAAERAEAERREAERAERERIQAEENERLKREAAAREEAMRAEREAAAAERARVEAEAKAAREEADRAAAALAAEKEATARAERERAAAEEKRVAEEAEGARRAATAPDRDKLTAFAATIRTLPIPDLTTEAGEGVSEELAERIRALATWIEHKGASL